MKKYEGYNVELISVGDSFEIVGLEHRFRNLKAKRITDCSVTIEGQIQNDSGEFTPIGNNYSISCQTKVRKVFNSVNNKEKKDPVKSKVELPQEEVVKRKRGRPRKNPPK